MFQFLRNEAYAYLKIGLNSAQGDLISERTGAGKKGALFVPGVGATAAHFLSIKTVLRDVGADWFDAFNYFSLRSPEILSKELKKQIEERSQECEQIVLIGHSLGGLLLRSALQHCNPLPKQIAGFIAISSPLHGTWTSRYAPSPALRQLLPSSQFVQDVTSQAYKLSPLLPERVLTIGAQYDPLVMPAESAFIDRAQSLLIDDATHAGILLRKEVRKAVGNFFKKATEDAPKS